MPVIRLVFKGKEYPPHDPPPELHDYLWDGIIEVLTKRPTAGIAKAKAKEK